MFRGVSWLVQTVNLRVTWLYIVTLSVGCPVTSQLLSWLLLLYFLLNRFHRQ
jgi:hypothetical protein